MKVIKSDHDLKGQKPYQNPTSTTTTSLGRRINFNIECGSTRYVCACISEKMD